MFSKLYFTFCFISVFQLNFAQEKAVLDFSFGQSYTQFTDFATSPLKYDGISTFLSVGHNDLKEKRQSEINFSYTFGNLSHEDHNQHHQSKFQSLTIEYTEAFKIGFLSSERRNIKFGGQFNSTTNLRKNEALFNSSEGVEVIGTLFGSLLTRFYFQKEEKTTRVFFVNLNVGVINSYYRNGYAYINQSPVLNEDNFFEDYRFSIFSGHRYQTNVGYTWNLNTGNAISLAYQWEAYSTTEINRSFQLAYHLLKLSFHFNLKSKV